MSAEGCTSTSAVKKDQCLSSCTVDFTVTHSWTINRPLEQQGFRHGLPMVSEWFEVLPQHAYRECFYPNLGRVRYRLVASLQPDRRLRLAFHPAENMYQPGKLEVTELDLRQLWFPGIRDIFSTSVEVRGLLVEVDVPQAVLRTGCRVSWKFQVRKQLL